MSESIQWGYPIIVPNMGADEFWTPTIQEVTKRVRQEWNGSKAWAHWKSLTRENGPRKDTPWEEECQRNSGRHTEVSSPTFAINMTRRSVEDEPSNKVNSRR